MTTTDILDKELIDNTQLWRLVMRIEDSALHVVLYSTFADNSLIYRKIALDSASPSPLKALENAVYDNPLLLSDFLRIDCIVATDKFALVPPAIDSTEAHEKIFAASFPEFDGEIHPCHIASNQATILMGLDSKLADFLRRTFNNPRLHHHLSPLCRYFFHKSKSGNTAKMYAILRDSSIDVIAFSCDSLLMANTFKYRDPMDAVYYIMVCRQQLGLDPQRDELLITGNTAAREIVSKTLRQYLSLVMPVIFPSAMFKAGREAMKAPFDLIVLPLCE